MLCALPAFTLSLTLDLELTAEEVGGGAVAVAVAAAVVEAGGVHVCVKKGARPTATTAEHLAHHHKQWAADCPRALLLQHCVQARCLAQPYCAAAATSRRAQAGQAVERTLQRLSPKALLRAVARTVHSMRQSTLNSMAACFARPRQAEQTEQEC